LGKINLSATIGQIGVWFCGILSSFAAGEEPRSTARWIERDRFLFGSILGR
jgi:hypothetical protein